MVTLARLEPQLLARIASIRTLRWQQPSERLDGWWTVTVVPALGRPETQTAPDLDDALGVALALIPCAAKRVPIISDIPLPDESMTSGELGACLRACDAWLRDIAWNDEKRTWQLFAVRGRMEAAGFAPRLQDAIGHALTMLDANLAAQLELAKAQAAARRRAAEGGEAA